MIFLANERDIAVLNLWFDSIGLTRRKASIVIYLIAGESNKSISDSLSISEKTVKAHVTEIFKKLGIKRRSSVIWSLPLTMSLDMERVRMEIDPVINKQMVH